MTPPSFDFEPRTRILFGPGTLSELGSVARTFATQNVLLVTDHGLKDAGHPQRAMDLLRSAGLNVLLYEEVHSDPTTEDVERGLEIARTKPIELVVGLGGGSSMDCAKGINFLLTNGGKMEDYWGNGKATKPLLPMIAIPTTAGTGSEAQSYAIIARREDHMKMACGDKKAACRVAILDPELTLSMPPAVTAVTGIDALSHALESHVSTRRNSVSQLFSRAAWQRLSRAFPMVLEKPHDLEARSNMLLGAHWAGAAIENSMLGATHACANPLSAHLGMTHGVAIGVMLPHVLRFNAEQAAAWYVELAGDAGLDFSSDAEAGEALALYVATILKVASLPTALPDEARDLIPQLANEAAQQWTGKCNPRPVDAADFVELYRQALSS